MATRRSVILGAAVLIALLAGVATYSWLNGVDSRANGDTKLVRVYVVKKDITRGLPADEAIAKQYVAADRIQAKYYPATAVVDLNSIKGKVAIGPLPRNVPLVEGNFVDPKVEQITNSQRIQRGRVAVSVSVDPVHAVSGLLVPGDKVDLMYFTTDDKAPQGATPAKTARYLYQNVEVLFIGTNAAPTPGETAAATNPGSNLITFSVPADAAQKIALASEKGIYLTLVPPDNQPKPIAPVSDGDLTNVQGPLTPYEG